MNYWDSFYETIFSSNKVIAAVPSQFCIFTTTELLNIGIKTIVEFGSGTGRDSFFFNKSGFNVIAFDSCEKAINECNRKAKSQNNISFHHIKSFSDSSKYIKEVNANKCFYTRFFIHALSDNLILDFIDFISNNISSNDYFFSEFRIKGDEKNEKVTPDHFRNYISETKFLNLLKERNIKLIYKVTGKGYAKYKNDDAFVIRIIAKK